MKRKAALSALLALAVAAPAVIAPIAAPSMAPTAQAQVEYPDVPLDHWAYNAINKLSQAGIIEGHPSGQYNGGRAMTRYEFAVAIARLLEKIGPGGGEKGDKGDKGDTGATGATGATGPAGPVDISNLVTQGQLRDAIAALTTEFQNELRALGVRVDDLDARVTALENRVVKAPRLTITPSLLHRTGVANYIDNDALGRLGGSGVAAVNNAAGTFAFADVDASAGAEKFSYTDFELRLTDRVSDTLSVNAALRSLSGTIEDPWAGESGLLGGFDGNGLYLREANAVADLGSRGMTAILGRQRTKIAQGLLYDNDLSPTDQLHAMFNVGPFEIGGFIGTTNNNTVGGLSLLNPYIFSASNLFIGSANAAVGQGGVDGSFVGFPGIPGINSVGPLRTDDNEAAAHAAVNLFKIAGNPVRLGGTYLFDGVGDQEGYGLDLTMTLFNRNVGIEYTKQNTYFNGNNSDGSAYNITVPVLRMNKLDLDLAYGRANDDYEFFLASSANPFARTYGEAIFDRPNALGAPLINGDDAGGAAFMAAKRVFDINGTLRLIKRLPLQFRYYNAKGSEGVDLGHVWTVGSTFNLTQGVDLEVKYGRYTPEDTDSIEYFRAGFNVGF
jgi:hypothetical protein